jgi:exopolyphosphatase/guanosine-5'-triphosphate,3'-diphosphate pyrophosphatase
VKVAVVDLGTNSCRLLLADVRGGGVEARERMATVTRLGEGVDRRHALGAAAVRRTTECLEAYGRRIERFAPQRRRLIATSVLRDATDGRPFLDGVERRFGLPWRILGGDEEAALGFAGAASALAALGCPSVASVSTSAAARLVLLDIGGGSTEIAIGRLPASVTAASSAAPPASSAAPLASGASVVPDAPVPVPDLTLTLDVGSVRLTERYLLSDPPTDDEWCAAQRFTQELLDREIGDEMRMGVALVVGVAGTVTTLVAYKLGLRRYDPELVHGHQLSIGDIERAIAVFRGLTSEQRAALPGIQRGREDVIPAGALIALEACRRLGVAGLVASEADLLDGVALGLAAGS